MLCLQKVMNDLSFAETAKWFKLILKKLKNYRNMDINGVDILILDLILLVCSRLMVTILF